MSMKMVLVLLLFASAVTLAQVAQPAPSRAPAPPVAAPSSMPVIGPEMNATLSQLEQTAQQTSADLGNLSVRKWKTESAVKEQTQHDINSVQSNVSGALPTLVAQVRSAPDSVVSLFNLYRNVDALLDVVRGLTESAGAFGSKSEFETLRSDSRNLDSVRASLASQLSATATATESTLTRMRAELAQARAAAAPAPPPKKVIIDDNEPAKKPVRKKKPATGKAPAPQAQKEAGKP